MVSEEISKTLFPLINGEDGNEDKDVLSPQLRSNFEKLKAYQSLQEKHVLKFQDNNECDEASEGKRRKASREDKKGKKRKKSEFDEQQMNSPTLHKTSSEDLNELFSHRVELAAQTLVTAESEIAMYRNGIAELESLLELNEEKNCSNFRIPNSQSSAANVLMSQNFNVEAVSGNDENAPDQCEDLKFVKKASALISPSKASNVLEVNEN